ncbi:flagellar motor switch protein FliM [Gottschalkia purinilytica]|uniref:Flagellar motor switch protein FliM n=1 Tax=Gottschalkia purinilytica TaxID=1503 RepID=A0A0L0WBC5_GOTPU|nr:flagellar motor switch protein FliM [Gottschalkia purinilytica]KNF08824.1 flagellar motor switch protein FliM [Gottschalkia purinilytica]
MTEVLSQNEIDALLNALSSGEVDVKDIKEESDEKRIRNYDFRNPQKIAKDQLRTLEIMHENLARLLQTFLSGYLRAPVKISVLTVDQYAYSEFSNAISNPAFISVVNFDPLSGQIVLDTSPNIAFTIIDRLLGGNGDQVGEARSFTEIELILLRRVMTRVVDLIAQAWDNVIILNPSLEKIETNSQFAQIVSPNETITLITMNMTIGETEGMINVCIPHLVIEPILNKLSTKLWFSSTNRGTTEKDKEALQKRIRNTYVPINAELSSTTLTVGELLDLQIGDVIKLSDTSSDEVKINIGPYKKFYGKPGTNKNRMAVKITRAYKDGDESDD